MSEIIEGPKDQLLGLIDTIQFENSFYINEDSSEEIYGLAVTIHDLAEVVKELIERTISP